MSTTMGLWLFWCVPILCGGFMLNALFHPISIWALFGFLVIHLFNDIDFYFSETFSSHTCGHNVCDGCWNAATSFDRCHCCLNIYAHMHTHTHTRIPVGTLKRNEKKRAKGEIVYCVHCVRVQWNGVAFFFVSVRIHQIHINIYKIFSLLIHFLNITSNVFTRHDLFFLVLFFFFKSKIWRNIYVHINLYFDIFRYVWYFHLDCNSCKHINKWSI